ncbi:uncharacterized protein Z519_11153 [Cladophialophora bantiana CBS 173.52]|uniref:Uncharacterized protein n=1 Tax=Cladophialophora bantiana (strain ATCC 10958 / CBS 173.52 / CDC B-1940 / NIH 8579) TaxID=1442370 RepID=A0A0D2H458_CLAB1|nr:uncharacterized protein Z519_11153 [Cladophialophora bantiana CBS 173.52]KIW88043.1 hypothetical protein Z519_11153 [Cladophialophora bantiana CBS 173.52]
MDLGTVRDIRDTLKEIYQAVKRWQESGSWHRGITQQIAAFQKSYEVLLLELQLSPPGSNQVKAIEEILAPVHRNVCTLRQTILNQDPNSLSWKFSYTFMSAGPNTEELLRQIDEKTKLAFETLGSTTRVNLFTMNQRFGKQLVQLNRLASESLEVTTETQITTGRIFKQLGINDSASAKRIVNLENQLKKQGKIMEALHARMDQVMELLEERKKSGIPPPPYSQTEGTAQVIEKMLPREEKSEKKQIFSAKATTPALDWTDFLDSGSRFDYIKPGLSSEGAKCKPTTQAFEKLRDNCATKTTKSVAFRSAAEGHGFVFGSDGRLDLEETLKSVNPYPSSVAGSYFSTDVMHYLDVRLLVTKAVELGFLDRADLIQFLDKPWHVMERLDLPLKTPIKPQYALMINSELREEVVQRLTGSVFGGLSKC